MVAMPDRRGAEMNRHGMVLLGLLSATPAGASCFKIDGQPAVCDGTPSAGMVQDEADQRAVAICQSHTVRIAAMEVCAPEPCKPHYAQGWEICSLVDLDKAKREREAQDAADLQFLKDYLGEKAK